MATTDQTPYAPPETTVGEQVACPTCNALIHRNAEICPKCGVRQRKPASKLAFLLLAFFLGGFGIHRFYIGSKWIGTLYLLFFWTGIPALLALIEFVFYLFVSADRFEDDYTAHSVGVLVVLIIVLIPLLGIIAAVAIPAYSDYLKRSKVSEAIQIMGDMKEPIYQFYKKTGEFPSSIEALKLDPISGEYTESVEVDAQALYVQATLKKTDTVLGGQTIRLTFDPKTKVWRCSTGEPNGIQDKYLPSSCRQ
jgi:TM2 domain-containing membrane protein YozV/type II secretory pathway pseudopilin PulG